MLTGYFTAACVASLIGLAACIFGSAALLYDCVKCYYDRHPEKRAALLRELYSQGHDPVQAEQA